MSENIPEEFFEPSGPITLSAAAGAVFIITNGMAYVFNFNPRWLGLLIAMGVSTLAFYVSGGLSSGNILIDIPFIIINGFLTYASATGLSVMTSNNEPSPTLGDRTKFQVGSTFTPGEKFFTRWW